MAQGRRAQVDQPCLRQDLVLDLRAPQPHRRHSTTTPATFPACQLPLAEREEISRGLVHGHSLRRIACSLARAPSAVSRQIAHNGGSGPYRAAAPDRQAWHRARRPKACKLARHPELRRVVATLLRRNWSPQQIAGLLKSNHPGNCGREELFKAFWRWSVVCPTLFAVPRIATLICVMVSPK